MALEYTNPFLLIYDLKTNGWKATDCDPLSGFLSNSNLEYAYCLSKQSGKLAYVTEEDNLVIYDLEQGELYVELLGQGFTWLDTGTHESLADATNFVKTLEQHQHRKIACLEEIAYRNGWIGRDELLEEIEVLKKNQYGQYLIDVLNGRYLEV